MRSLNDLRPSRAERLEKLAAARGLTVEQLRQQRRDKIKEDVKRWVTAIPKTISLVLALRRK